MRMERTDIDAEDGKHISTLPIRHEPLCARVEAEMRHEQIRHFLLVAGIRLLIYALVFTLLMVTDKAVATFVDAEVRAWMEYKFFNWMVWGARGYATYPGLLLVGLFLLLVNRRKWPQLAVAALLLLLVAGLTELGKVTTSRVRPEESLLLQKVSLRSHVGGGSFPSGHAATSFSLYASLGRFYPRLSPVFLLLAIACSGSRVLLLRHYPSDVFAGALIGYYVTKFSLELLELLSKRDGLIGRILRWAMIVEVPVAWKAPGPVFNGGEGITSEKTSLFC